MFRRSVTLAATALLWAGVAHATPVTQMKIGGSVYSDPSGLITHTLTSGTFSGSSFIGSGYPFAGSGTEPQIDIGGTIKVTGTGTLVAEITQTGITDPSDLWNFDSEFSATIKTLGLSMSYATYYDLADAPFATTTLISKTSAPLTATGSFTDTAPLTAAGPFSITEVLTFTSTKRSSLVSSFDASLSGTSVPVPEPATLSVLGAGLLGLVGAIRRRQRRGA
jgi:hypothetical protein